MAMCNVELVINEKESKDMKYEELIEEIERQIKRNRYVNCYLSENNALLGKIKTVLKKAGDEYERGCEDAWEFARKLELAELRGGFDTDMQMEVFGRDCDYLVQNVLVNHKTYKEALSKVESYEQKKKEEAKKIEIGDVVECTYKYNTSRTYKGIVRAIEPGYLYIMTKGHIHTTALLETEYVIKKTGKHINLQEMLDSLED